MSNYINQADITNPALIGRGYWGVIHTLAFNANTRTEQKQFIKTMNIIAHQFPCRNCSKHAKEYIKNHPMEEYIEKQDDGLSMFKWTWKFHNAVNHRIGKEIMSYEMAVHIYTQFKMADQFEDLVFVKDEKKSDKKNKTEKSVCSKECSEADKPKIHKTKSNDKIKPNNHKHKTEKYDKPNDKKLYMLEKNKK
jgi:hypothetical protein